MTDMRSWGFCQKSCGIQPVNFVAKHVPSEISGLEIIPSQVCKGLLDDRLNFDAKYDICVAKKIIFSIPPPTFKVR